MEVVENFFFVYRMNPAVNRKKKKLKTGQATFLKKGTDFPLQNVIAF